MITGRKLKMNTYSKCPIDLVVRLFKKKWVIEILRDLFFGKSRFSEFSDRYERDVEYILTKKGQALNKIVYELAMFSIDEDLGDTKFNEETKGKMKRSFKDKLLFK